MKQKVCLFCSLTASIFEWNNEKIRSHRHRFRQIIESSHRQRHRNYRSRRRIQKNYQRQRHTKFFFWKIFRSEFDDCAKNYFDAVNKTKMNVFWSFLAKQNVWIQKNKKSTTARAIMNVIHEKKRFDWTVKKITECYHKKKLVSNDLRSYVIWLDNNRTENENLKSKNFQHQNWKKYRRISIISFFLFLAPSKQERKRSSVLQQLKQQHQNEN